MKEFFSNAWVVSIISGIVVFFITNTIIMFQDKRHQKKQIYEANTMLLNHLRGYVVDNGFPQKEIINAVKSSVAREYNVKNEYLLSIKLVCEELVKDIIGNIYISNDNKKKYINMLQENLKQIDESEDDSCFINSPQINKKTGYFASIIAASISGITTIIISIISLLTYESVNISTIYSDLGKIIESLAIIAVSIVIFSIIKKFKK